MSRNLQFSTVRLICLGGFYLLLLVLYATAAPAQNLSNIDGKPGAERIQELVVRLQLSDEQRTAIQPIMEEFVVSTRAVLEKHGVDPKSGNRPPLRVLLAMRGDMEKNRTRMEGQMSAVLSPGQMDEFRKIQKEQREERRARMKRAG
ncbi:hypothetical protein [Hoeflea sp. TYP-13]|uniref:hypothetical protein n=1 Tax=Hoeflea sp. TYP-13 TaxID=3230023 RepID=UPI0034C60B31